MTYSNLKSSTLISSLSFILAFGGMISCSGSKNPQVKNANNSTFIVAEVKKNGEMLEVGEPNAQGQFFKKTLPLAACLKDVAGTNSTSNLKFKVIAGDIEVTKISDENGCIQWREVVEFEPEAAETNIFMTRSFEAAEKHSGKVAVNVMVNPWKGSFDYSKEAVSDNSGGDGTISYKLKDLKASVAENYKYDVYVLINSSQQAGRFSSSPLQEQTEVSKLYLKSQGIDYSGIEIDQLLNLTFPYDFEISLSINLLKQTTSGLDWTKIKRGNFLFNLVFAENTPTGKSPDASNILAVGEFKGSPTGEASLVQLPIILKFKKVASLSRRVAVYLTITSLDKPTLFSPQHYSGRFNGVDTNSNLEISLLRNKNDKSAIQLSEEYHLKYPKTQKSIAVDEVLNSEGFKEISKTIYSDKFERKGWFGETLESKEFYVNLNSHLNSIGTNSSNAENEKFAICGFVFEGKTVKSKDSNMKACTSNPGKYLNAELSDFVVAVEEGAVEATFGTPENMDLTASFELSENSSKEAGYSFEGSVGAGINFGLELGDSREKVETSELKNPIPGEKLKKSKSEDKDKINSPTFERSTVDKFASKISAGLNMNLGLDGKSFAGGGVKVSENDNNTTAITTSQSLSALPFSLRFKVKSKKCLLITVKEEHKKAVISSGNATAKYFCGQVEEKSVVENYYLLKHSQVKDANPVVDLFSTISNPLSILVRGTRPYGFLKTILTSEDYKFRIFLDPYKGMRSKKVFESESNFMTQEAPLMLSSTRKILL